MDSEQVKATAAPAATKKAASDFYVVGIGASAGGLEALEDLFRHVPVDSGMAFVIVQHLSPDFKSLMSELLARHTTISIHRVEDGMQIERDGIYLIPPKNNMALSHGKLLLTEQDPSGGLNLPIDVFFRSLALDAGERAIAVVLSGTGSDGSRGIEDVHKAGGLVIVQDIQSAKLDGMPRTAIATGLVDVVARPEMIPTKIMEYTRHPDTFARGVDADDVDEEQDDLGIIFRMFRTRYGLDFDNYKATTVHRRLERRVKLTHCHDLSQYVARLKSDAAEVDALYRDLLVEVTYFFRDPAAFEVLRRDVIPGIVDEARDRDEVRVWVPGCATGEEAYSLAMLFHECAEQRQKNIEIKVFATDVHQQSLETAGTGVYSADSVARVPDELKQRYFQRHSDLYHVTQHLRQLVIFASQDIINDPPFTKIDLLSCRNVLIYLEPAAQRRVLAMFHFGLKTGGVMMLGPSETLGEYAREFETVDNHWRIYRKLRDVRLPDAVGMSLTPALNTVIRQRVPRVILPTRNANDWLIPEAGEQLLQKYVPPSLLVNEHFELVHSFGEARKVLSQPEGAPTLDVRKMVEGDLRMAISAALHRVSQENKSVVYSGVRVESDEGELHLKVVVEPYTKRDVSMYLICLEEMETPKPAERLEEAFDAHGESAERVRRLERELDFTRESLQSTVEELETSNEELQSTNEELVASNEELQSTNEELHSVNEELYTVSAEHQGRIVELTELTGDMDNLLRSTDIGTIFLDRDLRIRKFTPAVADSFHVLEQDIGRPIEHIAHNLNHPDLLDDARGVLSSGKPIEQEVRNREGKTFLSRIQPYRSTTDEIEGVVLTYVDITDYEELRRHAQNVQLTDSDLQEYVYAVSHDLQAPLRHITDHANRLFGQAEGTLSGDSQRSLEAIVDSADQTQTMIEALLAFSRVYTRGKPFVKTSIEKVLDQAQENLKEEIESCGARIRCDPLPSLDVDDTQLVQVFQHLIDNAIKYRGQETPVIHVGAKDEKNLWHFTIRDNGIGIDPQHFERIFIIFQRLQFREDVAGNGLGLALCKRIIQRHGGTIGVQAGPEGGSVFAFTLPVQD